MPAAASCAGSPARLIAIEDFFADPVFAGASISPDGMQIAYLAPAHGRMNVWVRGIDQEHDQAVCVTHDARRGIKSYYWTGDSRWLLYRQDTDGNEDWHVYRVDLQAPEHPAVDLTPLPPGSRVLGIEVRKSVPGSIFVGMNRRPLFFDFFEIDVASGETKVYREQSELTGNLFGTDGKANFYSSRAKDGTWEYYAVDEKTGDRRLIYQAAGPEHPTGVYPTIPTPDGEGLLLAVYQDSNDLRLISVDHTGRQTVVAAMPGRSLCNMGWAAEDFGYTPTLFMSERTGEVLAARFVGERPEIEVVAPRFAEVYAALSKLSGGVLGWLSSDKSEQKWVATFVHDREPTLTYLYDHSTGKSRLLFKPYPQLNPADLAPMKAVGFPARDGLPLHAFLTLPVGVEPKSLPLVLFVHGGPWAHDSWSYNREVQFMANRGYAVLQVNYRGSSGYGKRHLTCAIKQLAGTMHDDLIDAANWVVGQGIADPRRIGIFGGSYGGYAALVGVTFTPDFFAAAIDVVGPSSLVSLVRSQPEWVKPHLTNNWLLYAGDPDDPVQEADMLARSPITKVDQIRTPLMVVQGANDARVPKAASDAIVDSLRARGVPVEYILAEDEGHGFQNSENLKMLYRAVERHLAEHLGGRVATGPAG